MFFVSPPFSFFGFTYSFAICVPHAKTCHFVKTKRQFDTNKLHQQPKMGIYEPKQGNGGFGTALRNKGGKRIRESGLLPFYGAGRLDSRIGFAVS